MKTWLAFWFIFPAIVIQSSSAHAAIKDVLKSVCLVTVRDEKGEEIGQGSAVIVSKNGLAITCFHVLDDGFSASVKLNDESVYEVNGFTHADAENDFAIIKIEGEGPFEPIELGEISGVEIGDEVYTVGNPRGFEGTVAQGIISAIRTTPDLGKIIQTTAPISPGSSGGALVDDNGKLIGITKFLWRESQNLNFATPIDIIIPYLDAQKTRALSVLPESSFESDEFVDLDVFMNLMAEGGWTADMAESMAGPLYDLENVSSLAPMYIILLAKNNRFDDAIEAYDEATSSFEASAISDDLRVARAYILLQKAEFEKSLKNHRQAKRLFENAGEQAFAVLKKNKKHAMACSVYLEAHFGAEAFKALDQNSIAAIRNFPEFLFPWRNRLWALVFLDRYDEALELSQAVLRRTDVDIGVIYYWRGLFTTWKLSKYGYDDEYGEQLALQAIAEFQRAISNGNPDGYTGIQEVRALGFD